MYGELDITDPMYPFLLRGVRRAPEKLFYVGKVVPETFDNCIGVVGSRKISNYGRAVVKELVSGLVSYGFTIVSGFMYGVDIASHIEALESGGKTIAVMPCGIDQIVPNNNTHRQIYDELLSSDGVVISEYPSGTVPQKWFFPERNRIVAGMCVGVLIVEAAEKSGSLITASLAKDYDRRVFAVPGNIFSGTSKGTNKLIKNGAILVRNTQDIVSELHMTLPADNESVSTELIQSRILGYISSVSKTYDQLLLETGIEPKILTSVLTDLEIKGEITFSEGLYHAC